MDEEAHGSILNSKSFLASAAFVLLLVLGLVWVLVSPGAQRTHAPAPPQATEPVTASSTDAVGACLLPAGSQDPPQGTLGKERIRFAPKLVVPLVPGAGPGVTDPVSRCFAHTPTGSVVAAVNFLKWMSSNERLEEVITTLVAPGADQERMIEDVKSSWDGSTNPPLTVLGYKIEIRNQDEVLVTLVAALPDELSNMTSWPLVMTWVDGDWKVRVSPSGDWGIGQVRDLEGEGFTGWVV